MNQDVSVLLGDGLEGSREIRRRPWPPWTRCSKAARQLSMPSRSSSLISFAPRAHVQVGDRRSANAAIERALALAEPDRLIFPFVMTESVDLLEACLGTRPRTPRFS
jgi:hypothetical protein